MSIVNTDIIINKKAPKRKNAKAVVMNPHNKFAKKEIKEEFHDEEQKNHFSGFIPEELVNNSKSLVIKGASMVAKSKSDVLYQKLASSKYVNAYLNNYFMLNMMGQLNDHVKMMLVYGVCYLETIFIPTPTPEQTTQSNAVI